jgi:hypothetical protein
MIEESVATPKVQLPVWTSSFGEHGRGENGYSVDNEPTGERVAVLGTSQSIYVQAGRIFWRRDSARGVRVPQRVEVLAPVGVGGDSEDFPPSHLADHSHIMSVKPKQHSNATNSELTRLKKPQWEAPISKFSRQESQFPL